MKKQILIILSICAAVVPGAAGSPMNLAYNGDFSLDLEGWQFIDNCQTSFGYNEAWAQDGKAWVHSNRVGNGGLGFLIQDIGQDIWPTQFRIDYCQTIGTGGGGVFFGLNEEVDYSGSFFEFVVGESDAKGHYTRLYFLGEPFYFEEHSRIFEQGTFEAIFDYESMAMTAQVSSAATGDTRSRTFPFPSLDSVSIRAVFLGASNNCWDGRNDQEAWFDNVVLEGAVVPAPSAFLLGSMGLGFASWLRRRRTF